MKRLLLFGLLLASTGLLRSAAQSAVPVVLPATRYQLPATYLRVMTLSYDSLAADLLWIHYVQQVPDRPADPALGAALANEMHAIVDLDPSFRAAYLHGSILLSVLGNRPCDALDILERGIQRYPDDWRLSFQAGYNCFGEIGEPECAAKHMRRAASMEGSPKWLPGLVARLLSDSTQHEAAIEYLTAEIARTKDERLKERLAERLAEAQLGRDLAVIDAAARKWRTEHPGRIPASIDELLSSGALPQNWLPPWDPFGGQYVLRDGRAASTSGRKGLGAFRAENQLAGTFEERLLEESVVARLTPDLGKPFWLWSLRDVVSARGGLVEDSIQGLEVAMRWATGAEQRSDFRQLQARAMLRRDVDALREARLSLLKESAGKRPTIEEIANRAGVDVVDPFGTRYTLSKHGEPVTDTARVALAPIIAGAQREELSKCR